MEKLIGRLREFRDDRDWAQFHTPKNLAMSVSIEAAELLEIFQWTSDSDTDDQRRLRAIADEASDVLIYLLLLFDRLGLNPEIEAFRKVDQNERRYPASRVFGKAKIQDER